MLGSFTERYPGLILKVEPNKQRVVVKGNFNLSTCKQFYCYRVPKELY